MLFKITLEDLSNMSLDDLTMLQRVADVFIAEKTTKLSSAEREILNDAKTTLTQMPATCGVVMSSGAVNADVCGGEAPALESKPKKGRKVKAEGAPAQTFGSPMPRVPLPVPPPPPSVPYDPQLNPLGAPWVEVNPLGAPWVEEEYIDRAPVEAVTQADITRAIIQKSIPPAKLLDLVRSFGLQDVKDICSCDQGMWPEILAAVKAF